MRSLEEPRDDGGTDLLRRRRLGVYETRSSLARHSDAVLFRYLLAFLVDQILCPWKILTATP